MTAPTRDLVADRWTPFVHVIRFEDVNLTSASFAMHIRRNWDATGSPLLALAGAAAGSQGISAVAVTDGARTHTDVTIRINETTMEGLEPPASSGVTPGADVPLVWDLHTTPSGADKYVALRGAFTIRSGSTQ